MAAPPACHHEEYQLIGAGHVDCCLFVFYINSDRNIENTFQFERKKKKRLQMKHKPTILSLVLIRMVTGDFTWLYKSYSYIQGGPGDSNQQSHGSPDTDMKQPLSLWKNKTKVKRLHETLETRVKCDRCLVSWWARKWLKKNKGFLIRTSFYSWTSSVPN